MALAALCAVPQIGMAEDSEARMTALAEVIVTAQKRVENLQDVPVPVTVLNAGSLVEKNQLRLQDYYTSIPGLAVAPTPSAGGEQLLSMRGVTTGGGTTPTVGIIIDDVPYGSSTFQGLVPDLDPSDLERVEALRGPQGTLYGASSMGGLLKFVTVDPSSERLSGHLKVDTNRVRHGDQTGYAFSGSINLPLSDTAAVRGSAFTRSDPGYIDNPFLHRSGINRTRTYGGRIAALWRPTESFTLKLSALYQDLRGDGANDVDVQDGLGDLQQNYLPGIGSFDRKVQAYSATVNARIGNVDLTAISGYNINHVTDSLDFSYALESITQPLFGVTGTAFLDNFKTNKFSQEIRATIPLGAHLEWLLGGFYTHERSPNLQTTVAVDPASGVLVSEPDVLSSPTQYTEYAAFTDLTVRVTERFDVQVGARESQIRLKGSEYEHGPYVPFFDLVPSPWSLPEFHADGNAFTYLLSPRLKLTPEVMLYARLASGYRPGGVNIAPGVPSTFKPDKTENYEIGTKGTFLDRTLSIDASVYYIAWKNIQISLLNPEFYSYNANAGRAKSEGVELQIQARPLQGLTIMGSSSWGKAVLTEPFPDNTAAYGAAGDRLPYGARFAGEISIQQDVSITSQVTGFLGGSVSYVGNRLGEFSQSPERQDFPAYARTDLRAGLQYQSWKASVFVTNLTDRRALIGGGAGTYPPFAYTYIKPRTIGALLSTTF